MAENKVSNGTTEIKQMREEALNRLSRLDAEDQVKLLEHLRFDLKIEDSKEERVQEFQAEGLTRTEAKEALDREIKDAWKNRLKEKEPTPEEKAEQERWSKVTGLAEQLNDHSCECEFMSLAVSNLYVDSSTPEAQGLATLLSKQSRFMENAYNLLYDLARESNGIGCSKTA